MIKSISTHDSNELSGSLLHTHGTRVYWSGASRSHTWLIVYWQNALFQVASEGLRGPRQGRAVLCTTCQTRVSCFGHKLPELSDQHGKGNLSGKSASRCSLCVLTTPQTVLRQPSSCNTVWKWMDKHARSRLTKRKTQSRILCQRHGRLILSDVRPCTRSTLFRYQRSLCGSVCDWSFACSCGMHVDCVKVTSLCLSHGEEK